jgi:hypothetical protein
MLEENIFSEIIFQKPERIKEPYSWIKHIPFAFFLMDVLRPEVFVELGVHTGNSFCAFCQAVEKLGLDTKCYGVDTWLGDDQAGFYDEKTYNDLSAYVNVTYQNNIKLLKMSFDAAVNLFNDKSIDLLHIDGLHTYDAVKKDFKTWLPKLTDKGVVIIHDIEIKEEGYGVWKFWEEVSDDYLSLTLEQGYGLGILLVGNSPHPKFKEFLYEAKKNPLYRYLFEKLGKLIYLEEKEPKTKVFIDCGNGFSDNLSVVKSIDISEEFIQLSVDLSKFSDIKSLRWDPLVGKWCIVKLKSISYWDKNGNEYHLDLTKISHNGRKHEDSMMTTFVVDLYRKGWLIFELIDPHIYLPINGSIDSVYIQTKIKIIDQTHIDHLYRKQEQINTDLSTRLQTLKHMPPNKLNCLEKYFKW